MARRLKFHHLPITKARINLGALARGVHAEHDTVIVLEKGGIPIAALVDIDELEDLLDQLDPELRAQIAEGRKDILAGRGRPIEELMAELRAKGAK